MHSFATDSEMTKTTKTKQKKGSKKTLSFMKKKSSFTIGTDNFPSKDLSLSN